MRTDEEAASKLGVHRKVLQVSLKNCKANHLQLDTHMLRAIPYHRGHQILGNAYYQPLGASIVRIEQYPVEVIHTACLSRDLIRASSILCVSECRLISHLSKIIINDTPLTFERFSNLSVEDARLAWGIMYAAPMMEETLYTNPNVAIALLKRTLTTLNYSAAEESLPTTQTLGLFTSNPKESTTSVTTDNHQPNAEPGAGL